jgi:hypothetical protein
MRATTGHPVHYHATEDGFIASCLCGWYMLTSTREQRQQAVDQHHATPRTYGTHGVVSEGD